MQVSPKAQVTCGPSRDSRAPLATRQVAATTAPPALVAAKVEDLLAAASGRLRACARGIENGRGVEICFNLDALSAAQKRAYGLTGSDGLLLQLTRNSWGSFSPGDCCSKSASKTLWETR